ncbi:DUF3592 domain-containing protein [Phreatobacter sp.]|uniref:DUF3592 domain-containing protein n=1 Tax=Phreatobacter sp. TaxID=1966341 RepID=UPI003F71AD0B
MEVRYLFIGFACAAAALLTLAIAVKWWEVRTVSRWRPAKGRIVSSRVVQREVSSGGSSGNGRLELRNFPAITFEYRVGNRTYRSDRYSVRENLGNVDVAETLARFRNGARVTVYYDPDDPSQAVIERDMPEGAFQALSLLAALIVVGTAALAFGTTDIVRWLRPRLPEPGQAGMAVILVAMSLVALRMGFMLRAQVAASRHWEEARGRIGASGIEEVEMTPAGGSWTGRRGFRSRVIYSFKVNGQTYGGDRVAFGAHASSTLVRLIAGPADRYPEGSQVTVYYNPANPAESVLERRASGLVILWVLAASLLAGAARLVGFV